MTLSVLYYTLLNKAFFVDLRRIDAQAVLIDKFLQHDMSGFDSKKLSDRKPLRACFAVMGKDGGGTVLTTADRYSEAPEGSVAVVPLRGDILKAGTMCSYGTEEIAAMMREAADVDNIVGIRLDVDSGGGCADAIAPLLDAISYCHTKRKAVVASCDLCASAAYYVACHCDLVTASNDICAEFGSIGVMSQLIDYAKYYEQHGIKIHHIYSDLSTYKNAPFEAALKGDYKGMKEEQLNPLARQFQEAVRRQRGDRLADDVEGLLQGRTFFAADAVKVGLADRICSSGEAAEEVRRLSAGLQLAAYLRS